MLEKVRLVIWDLDETFWKGTVTEGGIEYIRRNHDIVVELARRGIVSTICSKNDFDPIREMLEREDLWRYFVFPSISWEPKGPRIAALIEAIMLRPPTVMFIDDNPMNLNEARHFVPDIQTADPSILETLLDNPLFRGKEDSGLTRLSQYKLLEKRHEDEKTATAAGGSNYDFLRASDIRVSIEHDVAPHMDRAVELINRTNQLNFTKVRLSEDLDVARSELNALINNPKMQTGMIRVRDRYGNYGFVGFFALEIFSRHLIHFCFSCRTLGMEVERWVYERLDRPTIGIQGEVVTDIRATAPVIDWIRASSMDDGEASSAKQYRLFVSGGCEAQAIAQYAALDTAEVTTEIGFHRGGLGVQVGHTCLMATDFDDLPPEAQCAALAAGFEPGDFGSAVMKPAAEFDAYLLSFWTDGLEVVYRHTSTGLWLPFITSEVEGLSAEAESNDSVQSRRIGEYLNSNFTREGRTLEMLARKGDRSLFAHNVHKLIESIPVSRPVFILMACDEISNEKGELVRAHHFKSLNDAVRAALEGYPNVYFLRPQDFFVNSSDSIDLTHFSRQVYFRIHGRVKAALTGDVVDQRVSELA